MFTTLDAYIAARPDARSSGPCSILVDVWSLSCAYGGVGTALLVRVVTAQLAVQVQAKCIIVSDYPALVLSKGGQRTRSLERAKQVLAERRTGVTPSVLANSATNSSPPAAVLKADSTSSNARATTRKKSHCAERKCNYTGRIP